MPVPTRPTPRNTPHTLSRTGVPPADLLRNADLVGFFRRALEEDGGGFDLTSIVCGLSGSPVRARVRARQEMVVCGLVTIGSLLEASGTSAVFEPVLRDGDLVEAGDTIATLSGLPTDVLRLERPMLNTLSRLSGVATHTKTFADAIPKGCKARVFDTRKTTPGWRALEKYAVVCGGGGSHRMGLHDAVLIKDNHLAARPAELSLVEYLADACQRAHNEHQPAFIEVEVDTLEQLDAVLDIGHPAIDYALLDNFSLSDMVEAVIRRDERSPGLELEASGNVTLKTIAEIARTGVERISAGALTHQATWVDIGLDF